MEESHAKDMATFIPYEVLPEARNWRVGHIYRVKMVMKQVSQGEEGAIFEIVDATSLERDKRQRYYLSEGGSYGGK